MVAWAKANPGRLTLDQREGGFPHLAFEHLAVMGGFKFQHIPYKGATQIITDVIGGQVQLGIGELYQPFPACPVGPGATDRGDQSRARAEQARAAAIRRCRPGYDLRGWFGYVAPVATPREIVARLNDEINRAMKQPDVAEKMTAAGLIIATESPEFFGDMIRSDYVKYGKLVRDIGFKPQ